MGQPSRFEPIDCIVCEKKITDCSDLFEPKSWWGVQGPYCMDCYNKRRRYDKTELSYPTVEDLIKVLSKFPSDTKVELDTEDFLEDNFYIVVDGEKYIYITSDGEIF